MLLESLRWHILISEKMSQRLSFPRIDAKFSDDVLLFQELFLRCTFLFLRKYHDLLIKAIYCGCFSFRRNDAELRVMTNDI